MKSILIVTPHYAPETNAAARRLSALAEHLADQNWKVTILTLLPHHPQNEIYAGFDVPTPHTTEFGGVRVIRLRPLLVPKDNLLLRLASETLFCLRGFFHVLRSRDTVILGSTPYMFIGPILLLAAKLKGLPFVWEVRDLIWQYAKATGKRSYGTDGLIEKLMLLTARHCHRIVTATDGQATFFSRVNNRTVCIHNGIQQELLDSFATIRQTPIFDTTRPKIVYAGSLGYPQGLETLIDSAALLPAVDFIFVGTGGEHGFLARRAERLGLGNVSFRGYLRSDQLYEAYREADILVALLRNNPAFSIAQPSKIWEYMTTARPVVYAGEGEIVDILRKHEIAVTVTPEDPERLADAISQLLSNPERARALGARAFEFVPSHRNRDKLQREYERVLMEVLPSSDA